MREQGDVTDGYTPLLRDEGTPEMSPRFTESSIREVIGRCFAHG